MSALRGFGRIDRSSSVKSGPTGAEKATTSPVGEGR
jgi:hypothetical protein